MEKRIYANKGILINKMGRKELIDRLKNYRMIKAKMLQSRYKEEELKEITISASTFEEKFGTDVTSSVENKAIKILEYQDNIKEYALELAQLDNAMSVLSDVEDKDIRKRFAFWSYVEKRKRRCRNACRCNERKYPKFC